MCVSGGVPLNQCDVACNNVVQGDFFRVILFVLSLVTFVIAIDAIDAIVANNLAHSCRWH